MIGTYVTLMSVFVTILFILWLAYSNNKVLTKEREKETMYKHLIEQLWSIIDDIDTYGDMAKGDDKMFRRLVEARQKARWQLGITTDGQGIQYDIDNIPPALIESYSEGDDGEAEFARRLNQIYGDDAKEMGPGEKAQLAFERLGDDCEEPEPEFSTKPNVYPVQPNSFSTMLCNLIKLNPADLYYDLTCSCLCKKDGESYVPIDLPHVHLETDLLNIDHSDDKDAPEDIHPLPTGIEHHKLGRTMITHRRMFIMLAENQLKVCSPIDSTHYCCVKLDHDDEFNCFAKKVE